VERGTNNRVLTEKEEAAQKRHGRWEGRGGRGEEGGGRGEGDRGGREKDATIKTCRRREGRVN
jgi:hypothetical protein